MKQNDSNRHGAKKTREEHLQQHTQRPAPGKVTRTSKLSPGRGPAVQRKAPVSGSASGGPQARSAWDHTADPWMDAAHRGVTALAESGQGGGAAMPDEVRGTMETAFGADFSSVRIHEGPHAASIGALAYTQGPDIHFASGAYNPASKSGKELLGHELTHVVQQRAGVVSAPQGKDAGGPAINADPALEAEADRLGVAAARGQAVSVSGAGHGMQPKMAPGAVIQCGNAHPGGSGNEGSEKKEKEKEPEPEKPSESARRGAITSAYDKLQNLALKLIRGEEKALNHWRDDALTREWNWMSQAMVLAVHHGDASAVLGQLVMMDICEDVETARQAILDECKRRFGKGGGPQIPHMGRLMPDVQAPTEEDRLAAQKPSLMEGNDRQKQAMRLAQLELRGAASGALDKLHMVAQQSQVAAPLGGVNLQDIIASTLVYYQGPREEGHEIWVLVKDVVAQLCRDAQAAGYPIWDAAVQQAIAAAATSYASFSSTGSWSADREDNGATTRR